MKNQQRHNELMNVVIGAAIDYVDVLLSNRKVKNNLRAPKAYERIYNASENLQEAVQALKAFEEREGEDE